MANSPAAALITPTVSPPIATVADYVALLKPRVMSLVVFTAFVGSIMAPQTIHPFLSFVSILCIAVGAGASGALNMWYDRDIDVLMERTRNRPLPAGRVLPEDALALGLILAVGSVITLGLAANYSAALWLAFTIWFYAVVYTIALKRYTTQNIVIGGAAGAFPPVIGWFSHSPSWSFEPFVLFLIIFLWTPAHFWALALNQKQDYQRAKIPMLPAVKSAQATCTQILIYSVLTVLASLIPWANHMSSWIYGITVIGVGGWFLVHAIQLWRQPDTQKAFALFKFSIFYLFMLFLIMLIDHWVLF